jgi:hypothetical protein
MRKNWRDWLQTSPPASAPAPKGPEGSDPLRGPLPEPARPPAPAPDLTVCRPPDTFEAYRALLHQVFDPAKHRLARAAAREPALFDAFRRWRPGASEANLALLHPAYDRLSALMGDIYGFRPARLGHGSDMRGNLGRYDRKGVVSIAAQLLNGPVGEVFDTIVHEQVHCLQHALGEALTEPGRCALTPMEARLAAYWLREEPRAQAFYGRAITAELLPAYRRLGKEYHAFDTAEYVTHVVLDSYGRPRR